MKSARWTSSRWSAYRRQQGVSCAVHRTLAFIENQEKRFAVTLNPV
ncbi:MULTISPECIES: hypothetical protein [unclassified Streptomyces]